MRCGDCGFENPTRGNYCGECGAALSRVCTVCGTENPARFRYCGECGSPLDAGTGRSPDVPDEARGRRAADRDAVRTAERRHLTVMFCDLVGSTALSLRLDPEELRELVRSYQAACAEVIERFDGYVAQYLGDGILAYFGYPVAHEDEGSRAARAGLGVVHAVERLSQRLDLPDIELAVRVGIHTGEVVIGEVGGGARREHLALGDAPNIAARLQTKATPNTVVISEETRRLVDRAIEVEDLGVPALRGIGEQHIYRVVRERPPGLYEAATGPAFIGRAEELQFLSSRWEQVQQGHGQVVVLYGDPGIGKSKLAAEFARQAGFSACNRMETRCLSYYRNTAYFPFTDLLRRSLGCDPEQPAEERLQVITRMLEREGFALEETVPLFATLMSVPVSGEYATRSDSPAVLRERTRAALIRLLLASASHAPLLLVIEDLHWADPSSLDLLDEIVPLANDASVMVLLTARHEFTVRWTGLDHVSHVALGRLPDAQIAPLVRAITGGRALPTTVLETIIDRTDGVPLFVEELTRMLIESGMLVEAGDRYVLEGALPTLSIPGTLRDSLEARLDRLGRNKELAQLAAVIGREFDYTLIGAVAGIPDDRLRAGLDMLIQAGLLVADGAPPEARYAFKHAMIQEAAYQSLLRTTRQSYHLKIADALAERFPETARTQPELLAYHYTGAGLAREAVEGWTRAGRLALQRSGNAEAVAHLRGGLELVDRIEDAMDRTNAELDLLSLLGPALVTTRGYGAEEVQSVYTRARELAQRAGRTRHLAQMLAGLFAHHFVRGQLGRAAATADEIVSVAAENDDDALKLGADAAAGIIGFATGEFDRATKHLDRLIASYDAERHGPMAVAFGQDFGVLGLAYSAFVLGLQGRTGVARERARQAVAVAERIDHPHSVALALALRGGLHQVLHDTATVRTTGQRLLDLARVQGFGHWEMEAFHLLSWIAAHEGRFDEAYELTAGCTRAARRLGAELPQAFYQPTILEILLLAGRAEDALCAADELLDVLHDQRIQWTLESEIIRLRGLALAGVGRDDEAERALDDALALAASRGAHLLELRTATDLAELRIRAGRGNDIRELLESRLSAVDGVDIEDVRRARKVVESSERMEQGVG